MPHIDLSAIGLKGEWSPGPAERALATQLAAALPEAPGPDASILDRWRAVLTALNMLVAFPRENGDALFRELDPEGTGLQGRAGVFTMIDMVFDVTSTLDETQSYLRNLSQDDPGLERSSETLGDLEHDVMTFKAMLRDVADT